MRVAASPAGPAPDNVESAGAGRARLAQYLSSVRRRSVQLVAHLADEDLQLQSMPDASPAKWHLAHTTWFFETLVLSAFDAGYRAADPRLGALFNSYYESLGPRHPRPQRGVLSRPTRAQVMQWREQVDAALDRFIRNAAPTVWERATPLLELGLQHEQQHQELILTDLLHAFSLNPLRPAWQPPRPAPAAAAAAPGWWWHPGGEVDIGATPADGFAFDNETPRHRVRLAPYGLARRLVTAGEYLDFIADGGYRRPGLWLSDGWALVQAQGWQAPAYWRVDDDAGPRQFTLYGELPIDPEAPVAHLSFYEAAAYAEWAGARLPTEFEWEAAAQAQPRGGAPGPADDDAAPDPLPRPPSPLQAEAALCQLHGAVWQWTRSSYDPYPGFRPWAGAVGEYNGKFMVGQLVLRGSSCATPPGHARTPYRNFFPPSARWQFSGLRLACDAR